MGDMAPREARGVLGKRKEDGGWERQAGDGDGATTATEQITGDGNSTNEALCQRPWGKDGDDRLMALPQAASGAARGGGGDILRDQHRGE